MLNGNPNASPPRDAGAAAAVCVTAPRGPAGIGCVCSILTVAFGMALGSGGNWMRAVSFLGLAGLETTGGGLVVAAAGLAPGGGPGGFGTVPGAVAAGGGFTIGAPTLGGGNGPGFCGTAAPAAWPPGRDGGGGTAMRGVTEPCAVTPGPLAEGTLEVPNPGLGGRVMRTVSRLTSPPPAVRGGSEMRTVSFFGSLPSGVESGSAMRKRKLGKENWN